MTHQDKDVVEDNIKLLVNEFEAKFNHASLCLDDEDGCTCSAQEWLFAALRAEGERVRGEERGKIQNLVRCVSFSQDHDFICEAILPIKEMTATVREPNRFYCRECYQRGIEMENEAMGL